MGRTMHEGDITTTRGLSANGLLGRRVIVDDYRQGGYARIAATILKQI